MLSSKSKFENNHLNLFRNNTLHNVTSYILHMFHKYLNLNIHILAFKQQHVKY